MVDRNKKVYHYAIDIESLDRRAMEYMMVVFLLFYLVPMVLLTKIKDCISARITFP